MKQENEQQGALDFDGEDKREKELKVEEKPMTHDMQRVAATLLLQAALNYRQIYVPHDVSALHQLPVSTPDQLRTKGTSKITEKGARKMHHEIIKFREKAMTGMNERIEKEIKFATSQMDKNGADWIVENAKYLTRCMKYIIGAQDKDELEGLMVMYEQGALDFLFENSRKIKAEEAAKGFFGKYVVNSSLDTTQAMKENNDRFLNTLYETMKKEGQKMPQVEAAEVKTATKELLDRFPTVFESIQDNNVKKILRNVYGDVKDKTVQSPILGPTGQPITKQVTPKFSFDDLWMLRKGVGQELRDAKTETAQGQLKKIYGAISDDMETMFSKGGGQAGSMFKEANEAWKKYSLKFDTLRQAYDKSMGTTKAGEFFSPKKFSTELKNLANDPNYKKSIKWSPNEIEEMTGLANILQYAKRSGQFKENPPTGNRWGLEMTGAGVGGTAYAVGGLTATAKTAGATFGLSYLTKLLTTTKAGKDLSFAASKVEAGSPQMQKIIDKIYSIVPKMGAVAATGGAEE